MSKNILQLQQRHGRAKYIHAVRVAIRLTELSELSQALYRPLSLRWNYVHHLHGYFTLIYWRFIYIYNMIMKYRYPQVDYFSQRGYFLCLLPF